MNSLSWMIYAAEAVDGMKTLFSSSATFLGVAIIVLWIGRVFTAAHLYDRDIPSESKPNGSSEYQTWASIAALTRKKPLYAAFVLCALTAAIIPSTSTVYLIAASEAGETVVTSPDAVEMMGDLKAVIKKKLKEELGTIAE